MASYMLAWILGQNKGQQGKILGVIYHYYFNQLLLNYNLFVLAYFNLSGDPLPARLKPKIFNNVTHENNCRFKVQQHKQPSELMEGQSHCRGITWDSTTLEL